MHLRHITLFHSVGPDERVLRPHYKWIVLGISCVNRTVKDGNKCREGLSIYYILSNSCANVNCVSLRIKYWRVFTDSIPVIAYKLVYVIISSISKLALDNISAVHDSLSKPKTQPDAVLTLRLPTCNIDIFKSERESDLNNASEIVSEVAQRISI